MKKVISLLLSVIMIFSLVSTGVSAAESQGLTITVANDLHYNLEYGSSTDDKYAGADYSHVPSNGQLWIESILIVEEFFEKFKQSDSEILLLPGDLADRGRPEEHEALTAELKALEAAGKRVYVVPGNHDYYKKVTPEQFADYYRDFGYGEAIATDKSSASYVVDLDSEYRLLAIDSCLPGKGESGIDKERKAWIEEQAKQAQADGKKVIAMMHHNLLNHFFFGEILHPGGFVDSEIGLPELFAQYNIKYAFTAHTHSQDIKAYTGKNGVTVYDVLTSSLNLYPLPYRTVTLGEEVKIKTEYITEVDMSSKQGIISDNCYELAVKDFRAYALECTRYGLTVTFDSYLEPAKIKSLLKLDEEKDAELCAIIDKLIPRFTELVDTPMYVKYSEGGESLEKYAEAIRLTFPETDIKSFRELAIFLYQQYVEGDENFGIFSTEYILATASVATIMNLLLAEVSAEDYANLLNYLTDYFNINSLSDFTAFAGDAISRLKGIDIFVSALGNTVLLHFSTDELPADNGVTLPGYTAPAENDAELSFFERIIKFFTDLFDYILRIFGLGQ